MANMASALLALATVALRPGGALIWHDLPSSVPWVEVERAVASLGLAEPVYTVAGSGVAGN